jgi:plasmid maintenance system antidote protein VapI
MAARNLARKLDMVNMRFSERKSLQEIADKYQISRERVRQIIGNTGRDIIPNVAEKLNQIDDISPYTNQELAEQFGVCPSSISAKLNGRRHAIKKSKSAAYAGYIGEEIISRKLTKRGFDCKLNGGHRFDATINELVNVDFKTCNKPLYPPSSKHKSPWYSFGTRNKDIENIDFFIVYLKPTNDLFIVPQSIIGNKDAMRFTWPTLRPSIGKIQRFRNRFDLIWDLIAQRQNEMVSIREPVYA